MRVAVSAECMWWDIAANVHVDCGKLRCPFCGGLAHLVESREQFLAVARRFEQCGFAGHRALIEWVQGKCYQTRGAAWQAFHGSLSRRVSLSRTRDALGAC